MGCRVPLIEPIPLQDDIVTGVDHIQVVGKSMVRFALYIEGDPPTDGGPPDRILVRKIVIPIDCLPKAMRKALRFMAERGIDIGRTELSRLMS
jgi:hypothetical protein